MEHKENSIEIQWVISKIEKNKNFLKTCNNPTQHRAMERETLFLQNQILPIVQRETSLLHYEIANYVQRNAAEAIKCKCDALLVFIPLSSELADTCLIGVANPKAQKFGVEEIENIEIEIVSLGVGRRQIKTENINI